MIIIQHLNYVIQALSASIKLKILFVHFICTSIYSAVKKDIFFLVYFSFLFDVFPKLFANWIKRDCGTTHQSQRY